MVFGEFALGLVADRKALEAMDEGLFENLPGAGKPLDLDADWMVPDHLRAAFRVLKNAGVAPHDLLEENRANAPFEHARERRGPRGGVSERRARQ